MKTSNSKKCAKVEGHTKNMSVKKNASHLKKTFYSLKDGSHLKKVCHSWKNGSHLKKCLTIKKMGCNKNVIVVMAPEKIGHPWKKATVRVRVRGSEL